MERDVKLGLNVLVYNCKVCDFISILYQMAIVILQ